MVQGLSNKIIRNTTFNIIGHFWSTLVAIILIPYIINHIGIERYGIWSIVGVITGYIGLFDFGISTALVKYISEFYTKKEYEKINHVVSTGVIFNFIFAILTISIGFFIVVPLLNVFNIPERLYSEATFVFLVAIILFGISTTLSPFAALQSGLQRMDITNKISIGISIPMIIGTIYFLENGYGLPGLMVNNAIVIGITGITNIIIAFKLFPTLKFIPRFSFYIFKNLFTFGYKIQISKIANLLHFQMDRIILACFLNIGFVTYYVVAAQIASKIKDLPLLLTTAIFPAASELDARANKETLYQLYFRSMKYVILAGLPISLLIILISRKFINLWLGEKFALSILTLQILMVGYFLNVISGPGFFILNGIGKPQYGMKSSFLAVLLNLLLSILLVIKIGYFGVVVGTAISMIIAAVYFIFMAHKVLYIPVIKTNIELLLKPLISIAVVSIVFYIIINQLESIGWSKLIGLSFLYIVLFYSIVVFLNYFDDFDIRLIKRYMVLV